MRKLTSNYITMLPEKWCYCKAGSANQNIFRIQLKRKNHPPKFKTIMKKNLLVWAAGYASGRAAGRDLIILLEQGSSFVQQLQPRGIFQFFRQNAPAIAEGEAGVFVGQVVVRRCAATLAKQVLLFRFSKMPQAALNNQFFNPTLKAWSMNK